MQLIELYARGIDCRYFLAGLFSNHGPLYFVNTKMSFSKMGLTCHIAKIHSEVCFVLIEWFILVICIPTLHYC